MELQIQEIEQSLNRLNCFGTDVAVDLIKNMYYGKEFEQSFEFETTCSKTVKKLVREYSDCEKLKYGRPLNGRNVSIMCQRRKIDIRNELRLMQSSVDVVGADIALYCVSNTSPSRNTWNVFLNSIVVIESVEKLVRKYVELTAGREFDYHEQSKRDAELFCA